MHRKRPAFVPLYDRFVDYCYRSADSAPIPKDRRRTWRQFGPQLGAAIQADLVDGGDFFAEVASLATDPLITALRALDIVAWYAGRQFIGAPVWARTTDDPEAPEAGESDDTADRLTAAEVDERP